MSSNIGGLVFLLFSSVRAGEYVSMVMVVRRGGPRRSLLGSRGDAMNSKVRILLVVLHFPLDDSVTPTHLPQRG